MIVRSHERATSTRPCRGPGTRRQFAVIDEDLVAEDSTQSKRVAVLDLPVRAGWRRDNLHFYPALKSTKYENSRLGTPFH